MSSVDRAAERENKESIHLGLAAFLTRPAVASAHPVGSAGLRQRRRGEVDAQHR